MNTKTLAIGLIIIICPFTAILAQTPDFRNLTWGAPISAVKEQEKCKLVTEQDRRLVYDCPLADTDGKVVYTFTSSSKLMRAKYLITPDYFNTIFYIRDYRLLEELLTKKYGNPILVSPRVINKESIKEDEWGTFLAAGELFVEAKWATPKTEILLTMSKVGQYPAIQIDYISIELSKEDLRERSAKILKEL